MLHIKAFNLRCSLTDHGVSYLLPKVCHVATGLAHEPYWRALGLLASGNSDKQRCLSGSLHGLPSANFLHIGTLRRFESRAQERGLRDRLHSAFEKAVLEGS